MENESDVAIVGMACRFPGARNLEEFWDNLAAGVESISRLTDAEMIAAGVPADVLNREDYVKAAPVLDAAEDFDAAFFGFSPTEAAGMDPQHRLLLELSQTALDDAGCDPDRYPGRIGVYAGAAMNTYFLHAGMGEHFAEDYIPTLVGNDKDFLATRISYKLGLRGPSMAVQTACSTALVAVHLARQSLLQEESDAALAGAVALRVPHRAGYFYDGSGIVSPDGHVRAFDAAANGTVFGSGGGIVVLKRLADALAEGDRIYAVIKGSAVNNDGRGKAGFTAPSVQGQADAVVEALANAGLSADDISYLEAHGSGTPIGDRIEVLALTQAFRRFTRRCGYCGLGSVKTNVGHLDVAAGIAGLIKTALALQHRQIPPTLHFSRPQAEIDFPGSPFFVNSGVRDWTAGGAPLRAGVMATGMGGTNAHLVLEEAPAPGPADAAPGPYLLVLSAKTPSALGRITRQLGLALTPASPMGSVARTLQTGRRCFAQRRFLLCHSAEEAKAALLRDADGGSGSFPGSPGTLPGTEGTRPSIVSAAARSEGLPPLIWLLPGVGDQYLGMGRGLYEHFEVFREEVDACARILEPLIGADIRAVLYPSGRTAVPVRKGIDLPGMLGRSAGEPRDPAAEKLDETLYCQPALFTVEYALARLWMEWGIRPDRLVGHSMGEYVAACLAGVFSLPDALHLIAARATLVNALPRASMLAILLPESELLPLLGEEISISLINGPQLCVAAGPAEAMASLQKRLKARDVIFRPVRNAHPFHSRLLDPIAGELGRAARQVRFSPPQIPFISNVTGDWIRSEQAVDPLYWVEHARHTARFSDALARVWSQPDLALLEVGPGRTLAVLATQHPARPPAAKPLVAASLRAGYDSQPDADFILHNVGRLWLEGAAVAWANLNGKPAPRKTSLPGYPFERVRHWIEPSRPLPSPAAAEKPDLADWFYVPSWVRTPFPGDLGAEAGTGEAFWLIVGPSSAFSGRLLRLLEERGAPTLAAGPESLADWLELIGRLKARLHQALHVVHLGPVAERANQATGFHSLMSLAQALGEHDLPVPVRIGAVTSQVHAVTGEEALEPAMATATGLCAVIPKENPQVTSFRSICPPAGFPMKAGGPGPCV